MVYNAVLISAVQQSDSVIHTHTHTHTHTHIYIHSFSFLFFNFWPWYSIYLFIYLFIFGCVGSSLRYAGFSLWWLLLLQSTGSRCAGFSSCGSRTLERRLSSCGARGLVAPQHVGSSRTRAQTCVPCIGRWILNHCATREAPQLLLNVLIS